MRLKNHILSLCFCLWWLHAFVGKTCAFSRIASLSHRQTRRQLTSQKQFCAQPRSIKEVATTIDPIAEEKEANDVAQFQSGFLVLVSVPFAWGTFEPAVRYVYDVAPQIPTLVFSVAYYAVAVMGLSAVLVFENSKNSGELQGFDAEKSVSGGIELGTYLFLGNAFQVFGLRTVASDRAAFLLQLTTIFVPFLQAFLARSMTTISTRVWAASVMALAGVGVIALDGKADLSSGIDVLSSDLTDFSLSGGDLLIVGAAVLYTFHCVRLELYAKTTSAVRLAFTKAVTEMSLSLAAAMSLVVCSNVLSSDDEDNTLLVSCISSGNSIKSFISDFLDTLLQSEAGVGVLAAAAATTWIGLMTVAYTICAQSYGQKYVKAATANLIYTTQPLYTAFFAWLVLGETLGPLGYTGGVIILLAVLLVAVDENKAE
uniref:EamA domain-containing protein n=1 Tax=Amphora coffeiformis TaxID=265554 RepID=A0A7S3P932_9STRA